MNTFLEKINPSSDTPLHSQFHTLLETCFLKDHRHSFRERDSKEENVAEEKG